MVIDGVASDFAGPFRQPCSMLEFTYQYALLASVNVLFAIEVVRS